MAEVTPVCPNRSAVIPQSPPAARWRCAALIRNGKSEPLHRGSVNVRRALSHRGLGGRVVDEGVEHTDGVGRLLPVSDLTRSAAQPAIGL